MFENFPQDQAGGDDQNEIEAFKAGMSDAEEALGIEQQGDEYDDEQVRKFMEEIDSLEINLSPEVEEKLAKIVKNKLRTWREELAQESDKDSAA